MMKANSTTLLSLALLVSFAVVGCERSKAAQGATVEKATKAQQPPPAAAAQAKATRVVFVGKEHACECTKKTVDAGWAVLQKVLGTPAKLPVERLAVDTEGEKVEPYRQQKPMMALPAIYFVDSKGGVIEMLQGDITAEQLATVLR